MLVFIGTLHCNLTPHDELIRIIESFKPTKLLVEISQSHIESGDIKTYPDEMQAALAWAVRSHIKVYGFDVGINTLKENVSGADLAKLDDEQTAITSKHDWKDFNKAAFDAALETKTWRKIIDKSKDAERNRDLYKNILRLADEASDVTVVVTGSGHIAFFRSMFPEVQFPLR